jgi:hypothetical protein
MCNNKNVSLKKRYCQFRGNILRTGRTFELSLEEFDEITRKECHFCSGWLNEELKYCSPICLNKDNIYNKENCVPSCRECNAKHVGKKQIILLRTCQKCGKEKDYKEFTNVKGEVEKKNCSTCREDYLQGLNKKIENNKKKKEATEEWKENERLRLIEKKKRTDKYGKRVDERLKRYNLTIEQFEEMLEKRDNKCLICCKVKKLYIDHCHKENKVRGLLCNECNVGIGMVHDNVNILEGLIKYVKNF